jgi:hypothetical protein
MLAAQPETKLLSNSLWQFLFAAGERFSHHEVAMPPEFAQRRVPLHFDGVQWSVEVQPNARVVDGGRLRSRLQSLIVSRA